ncbi:MAG: BMP family ABC transporter substrate-binding protein [Chloroflexi bacterium]|nr:BMP family ABC transporter substrate-binding protein [Chloroflexota bacterium]
MNSKNSKFSRRQFLKLTGATAGTFAAGSWLSACNGAATPTPAVSNPQTEQAPANGEKMKIAFGHVGPVSDEGWTWSHDQGMKAVQKAFPNVETAFVENIPFSDEASRTFEQFIADGAKMLFITSEFADFTNKVVDKHPEVLFLEADGHRTTKNQIWYYVQHWYPAYLIGMAAGLLTKTNQLGYVASFPVQSVYANVNAFHLGARSVNPDVSTNVVLINSWFDPAAAKQAGIALADGEADFLFGIMDEAAYLQVAEERGIWAAMWNTDMRRFGAKAYVSSLILDWGPFYVSEVQAFLDGTWKGDRTILLPIGGGIDRDKWGENVPQDVQEQVDAVRDKMLNEGFNPFAGPIKNASGDVVVAEGKTLTDDEMYVWEWAVEGVNGMPGPT